MSKLDDILRKLQRMAEPNGLITSDIEWAEQAIKDLMLEIIGGDEALDGKYPYFDPELAEHHNQVKVELRQKVEEL